MYGLSFLPRAAKKEKCIKNDTLLKTNLSCSLHLKAGWASCPVKRQFDIRDTKSFLFLLLLLAATSLMRKGLLVSHSTSG